MARIRWLQPLKSLLEKFDKLLAKKPLHLDTIFTLLVSFVIVFIITRYVRSHDPQSLTIKNVAIHHFVWVKVFLIPLITATLLWRGPKATYFFAWIYGFCVALDFDELGMQLHLTPEDGKSMRGFWIVFIFLSLILSCRLIYRALGTLKKHIGKDELNFWS